MQAGVAGLFCFLAPVTAEAHHYTVGTLEILHPAIEETRTGVSSTCAHVTLTNSGTQTERFLGASIAAAVATTLVAVDASGRQTAVNDGIAIAPGATLDLHKGWCLLMRGVTSDLTADMDVIKGELIFEKAGRIPVEFMIDARSR